MASSREAVIIDANVIEKAPKAAKAGHEVHLTAQVLAEAIEVVAKRVLSKISQYIREGLTEYVCSMLKTKEYSDGGEPKSECNTFLKGVIKNFTSRKLIDISRKLAVELPHDLREEISLCKILVHQVCITGEGVGLGDESIVLLAKKLLQHSKVKVVTRDKRLAERLRKLGVDVEQDMELASGEPNNANKYKTLRRI